MIIYKVKSILNILANNILKYNVNIILSYTDSQVIFSKFDNYYRLRFIKGDKNQLVFSIYNKVYDNQIGKSIVIDIPSNEVSEIKLLFDTLIMKSEKFVENELKNLEL